MAGIHLFGPTQDLLAASLRVRAARHSLLTANVANADTPGYRPRDIDFAGVLQTFVEPQAHSAAHQGGVTLVSTHPLHQQQEHGLSPTETTEGGEALNRNHVELDSEITQPLLGHLSLTSTVTVTV